VVYKRGFASLWTLPFYSRRKERGKSFLRKDREGLPPSLTYAPPSPSIEGEGGQGDGLLNILIYSRIKRKRVPVNGGITWKLPREF